MSRLIYSVSQNVPGYGLTDGKYLPCSGVSGSAISFAPCSSWSDCKVPSQIKIVSLRCTSRGMFSVCRGGSGGYRRNPDFSRQNKHGFSRSRNKQNEERNGSDSLEESDLLSSKNGPLLSVSSGPKFPATASPGPREKEIVELFRKVQAQLRERAAAKVEKKTVPSQGQDKESGTVDSLLKLLRKHTTQHGKSSSSSSGSSREFILDHPEQNGAFEEESSARTLDPDNIVKDEVQEHDSPSFSRPVSKFQRRSPVPQVKFRPSRSDSVTDTRSDGELLSTYPDPEVHDSVLKIETETEPEPIFADADVFDAMSEDEPSDFDEGYSDDDAEEQKPILDEDLSAMKLTELRALAKSRGIKGFSKLKKLQLVELLSGGST